MEEGGGGADQEVGGWEGEGWRAAASRKAAAKEAKIEKKSAQARTVEWWRREKAVGGGGGGREGDHTDEGRINARKLHGKHNQDLRREQTRKKG